MAAWASTAGSTIQLSQWQQIRSNETASPAPFTGDVRLGAIGSRPMNERRNLNRKRVLKVAQIQFNKLSSISCSVRNISDTGACLEVPSPLGIPDEFTLIVESEALRRQCSVAWRRANRLGVSFH